MSSIIGKEVKMEAVIEPQDLKFIFVASRAFTADEKRSLEQFGKLVVYDATIQILSVDEIFAEKKCDFLFFNVTSQEDRKYLSSHFNSLKKYHMVFLKKDSENYDSEWITQFKAVDPIIIKKVIPCVRKSELNEFLTTFHKVHPPVPFYAKAFHWIFH